MSRVWVVGSINVDTVLGVEHLPRPGETVSGSIAVGLGGKGANQAIAAARAGAEVAFVGAVGDDAGADLAVDHLGAAGVDVSRVSRLRGPTGSAYVMVDRAGENSIVVVAGANAWVAPGAVESMSAAPGDVVVVQGELPSEVSLAALAGARRQGAVALWNPAPADPSLASSVADADVLVVNAGELADLSGCDEVDAGIAALVGRGVRTIVATLGAAGVVASDGGRRIRLDAAPAAAVDTTGAGDCFVGVLAARLAASDDLHRALRCAVVAAAISVTRAGASASMPSWAEIAARLGST